MGLRVDRFGHDRYVSPQWAREERQARYEERRLEDYAGAAYRKLRTASIEQLQALMLAGIPLTASTMVKGLARAAQDEIIRRDQKGRR